jgi:demethylmenaquinone methyltransferase/2-methoxy-6-polyprenyl-1,4-benzoquinol methylase
MSEQASQQENTHFGYQSVPKGDKQAKVADVFHSVASKYDIMNDLMSAGIHRLWKRFAIEMSGAREGHKILDLAGGTGDLTKLLSPKVGDSGRVVLADINESMLNVGRDRIVDAGLSNNVDFTLANAEELPFAKNSFDCVTMAFGLRNVTDKDKALASIYNVLKPGGRLLVLEFSKPVLPGLSELYDQYSFKILPKIGEWVTGDKDSYQYLAESIRMHPDQETLKTMFTNAGFMDNEYHNLTGGIVALHRGFKY